MSTHPFLHNPFTIKQAILFLYGHQTEEEQSSAVTLVNNGLGYNGVDASIMSSFAQQILAGKGLTDKQLNQAMLRLPKYAGQLHDEAWKKIEIPSIGTTVATYPPKPLKSILSIDADTGGLKFTPNVYPSKQIKSAGFSHFKDGAWHQNTPRVHPEVIADLKRIFGDIEIEPAVMGAMTVQAVALPTEISEHDVLFPFQKEAIHFMVTTQHCMVALAPGLGKTVCAIYAAHAAGCKKVLVVSPLSLLYNWRNEVKKWLGIDAAVVYKRQLLVPSQFTLTNYDTLRLHQDTFLGEGWDCIIVDETLLIKHRNTVRTKVVGKLVRDCKPKYAWLLSGAPVSRLYTDLYPQLNILNPKRFSSYWRFAERYCIVEPNEWSNYNITGNQPDAGKRILEDLKDMYFARSQEDVLDLPEFIFEDVHVKMGKEQDKLYGSMEEEFVAQIQEDVKLLAPNTLAQLTRLVQLSSNPVLVGGKPQSAKWDACKEMLQFEQGPFIIWTNFISTATHMQEYLGDKYRVAKLTGATPMEERQAIVDSFQGGDLDIIIAHPAVGKFGLTLTKARTAIYLERGHNGDDYYQSLYRIKRIGTTVSPHVIHLIADRADGSSAVDSVISTLLQTRKGMVEKITNMGLKKLFQGEDSGR